MAEPDETIDVLIAELEEAVRNYDEVIAGKPHRAAAAKAALDEAREALRSKLVKG